MNKENNKELKVANQVSKNSRKHFKYRSNECLNCKQPLDLSDRYCPYCSQLNSTKSLSLGDFASEFFSSIISYDSRLRYTVIDLLFKPGVISKNYIEGKRLRYTNPFRFFLSVSIVYFLLFSVINFFKPEHDAPFITINDSSEKETENDTIASKNDTIHFRLGNSPSETEKKESSENNTTAQDSISSSLKKEEPSSPFLIINGDTITSSKSNYKERVAKLDSISKVSGMALKFQIFRDFYSDKDIKDPSQALDSLHLEKSRFNLWLYKKNKTLDNIKESPRDFLNYMLSKVTFFLFFFAPFFALFFWLLYCRRPFTYMEHLVFIFHIFSFMFLSSLIAKLLDLIISVKFFSSIIIIIIGPVYFYLALRKFYAQSYGKTALKFILLSIIFFISSTIAAIVFFAGTAAFY